MKEEKITMSLESGNWKVNIFEIGNTYQIYAESESKVVHFMINKRDYLQDLLKKQNGEEIKENHSLSCNGRELLTQSEFNNMKKVLFDHMDADLSEEKFQWGIIPDIKN